ncbi:MAG: BACON domain-containing carbohydrate-binding protein [Acidobacteriota bacterium]|nr:BACON domain-containing carbohydrate-binding protein [Acidobacteriota bacterium]
MNVSARHTRIVVISLLGLVLIGSCLFAGVKLLQQFQPPHQTNAINNGEQSDYNQTEPVQAFSANSASKTEIERASLIESLKRKRARLFENRYDKPSEALEFFRLKRLAEGETEIPVEKYLAAYRQMELMPQHTFGNDTLLPSRKQTSKNAVLPAWTSLGPGNVGGRTRAIIIHPTIPTTIYAAGVAGGVWKSTNGGTTWLPVSDLISNLAVNSLAMDSTNPNTLYAGTGEGFFNNGAVRGAGIFKTTDGGTTWTQLAATNTTDFHYVNDLIVSPNNSNRIYAATRTGIWRSTDGGTAWTKVLNATEVGSTTTAINGGCLDLAVRTDRPTDYVFASCGNQTQARIFRNTDAGAAGAWIQVHTENNAGRTSLAIAPSNQDTIYAMSAALGGTFDDALHAVFRSTSSGDAGSWTPRVRNTDANKLNASILSFVIAAFATNCGLDTANTFGGQAWFDNVIAVDPADPNRVWAGGIDLFRSDDGGANWGMAAHAYQSRTNPQYVHPDQHAIVFHPQYNGATNQTVYIGNDGGIYRSDNARAATAIGNNAPCTPSATAVTWTSLNNGYGVTQFYHGSVYPNGATYFGGTQDNGTIRGSDSAGTNAWNEINGGDGGHSAVDPTNTNTLYTAFTGISVQKSTNSGTTFSPATSGINDTGLFITPYVMDPSNPQRLFLGARLFIWRTNNGATSWQQASAITPGSGSVSAIAVSPTNANFALAGMSDGFLIRTDQALTSGATTTWPSVQPRSGYVSSVAFDPTNKDIAYATYSTFGGVHVWKTVNAGAGWTGLNGTGAGTLPDVPVHSIVVDPTNTMRLYIGTDVGVFASTDGGTTWAVENTGFANVITEWLAINSTSSTTQLFAFTHGRGAWRVAANPTGCNYALTPSAQTFDSTGGNGNIAVTAEPNGCNWTAVSNAAWITVTSGASGTTNGTVAFSVAAYTGTTPRTGTITAAGKTFTVTQTGCATIASASQFFEAAGGMSSIPVTATSGCTWTVTGNPSWVTINSGAAGTGNGTVNFTVQTNATTSARQTVLTVAGQSFTILQGGANGSCAVTPIALNQAINGTIAVNDCGSLRAPTFPTDRYSFAGTAGQHVAIRADSSIFDSFLYLIDPTGAVVASNDDGDFRTNARIPAGTGLFTLPISGTYQIEVLSSPSSVAAGAYTLSLSSGSANCSYAVSPAELNIAAAGGSDSFNVTVTGSGCDWAVATNASWITITSGATGSGNGTVNFSAAANPGFARSGGVVVAGQLVTINQAGTGAVATGRWATQSSGTTNQLNQVFFLDDNQGWLVGANSTARATSNGGAAWNSFTVGGTLQNYHSVRFLDLSNGWVGGDRMTAITNNGGSSWPRLDFATGTRNRLFPVSTTNAFGVGELSSGGFHANTLIILSLGFGGEAPALSTLSNLRDVYFANAGNGWSVGDKGQIFRLTKSGNTFDEQTGATTQNLFGVFALDLCTAWAVGDGGVILKTTNAGQSWAPQISGVTTALRDIHFINADRGWAVGDGGIILVTWNGGTTWTPETSGTTADLRGVHTNTINAVYAVGANGTVVKRTLCNYTLSATMASFAEAGGSGSVNVTTTAGCPWTATSNANWITINSGSPGSGNGTLNFTVAANTGLARNGTITVAGQTFTVNQSVACPTIAGFTPARGGAGSSVVINGTNLTEVTAVRFANNVAAQFTVGSATQLTATVPAGAITGPITISKTGCGDVQTTNFIFCNPITINPATLNNGTIGVAYNQPLTATGGTAAYSFAVTAGALPNGLMLSGGTLSGTPTAIGTANFTVTATDANGCTGTRAYSLQILPTGYEADVFPRPNGDVNGQVTMSDWTQMGRFAAGLDSIAAGSEFQRADCAPRATFGNGQLSASDWVQAGRYAAGLDPVVPIGGPTAPSSLTADEEPLSFAAAEASVVRAEMVTNKSLAGVGKDQQVIKLMAQGGENALSFSLVFQNSLWKFLSAELTDDTAGASLIVNRQAEAEGKLGFMFAYPTGKTLPPGEIRLFTVTFTPVEAVADALFVGFGDAPLAREISDVNANRLPSNFVADYSFAGATACANVSAASFAADRLAAEQIVAAFGVNLATTTEIASSLPLPTSLGGTTVKITDGKGVERLAELFFVSPTQINYLLPEGLAEGIARVTITANGNASIGLIDVAPVAPSLFTANADGRGLASAVLLRVRADGSQSYEPVTRFDSVLNRSVAVPIVFGEPGEQLFLLLYGTGLRHHKGAIQASVGGIEAAVPFAGEVSGFVGLDQLNLSLPRSVAGRGEVSIQVNFGDRTANPVTVVVR